MPTLSWLAPSKDHKESQAFVCINVQPVIELRTSIFCGFFGKTLRMPYSDDDADLAFPWHYESVLLFIIRTRSLTNRSPKLPPRITLICGMDAYKVAADRQRVLSKHLGSVSFRRLPFQVR